MSRGGCTDSSNTSWKKGASTTLLKQRGTSCNGACDDRTGHLIIPDFMSELNNNNKSLLCSFLVRGFCRKNEDCEFSHDPSVGVPIPDNVCLFHLQQKCSNGSHCRFEHWSAEDVLNNYYYFGVDEEEEEEADGGAESCPSDSPDPVTGSRCRESESTLVPSPPDDPTKTTSSDWSSSNRKAALVPFSRSTAGQTGEGSAESTKSHKTYAQVAGISDHKQQHSASDQADRANEQLCPFAFNSSECPSRQTCRYLHGLFCDLCNRCCLHPFNEKQRRDHREECLKEHEKQMELSFAIQRSMDKSCGICMDTVMEKDPPSARRFGILEKCTHVFCLACIRKWRMTKQFDNRTIRSCPECRISSDFVIPSEYWVETKDDKDSLIFEYKKAMSKKACKYYERDGQCPFGNACFYLHQDSNGHKVDLPPPSRVGRRLRSGDSDSSRSRSLMDVLLWDYLEDRNSDPSWLLSLDLDDLLDMRDMGLLSSTDDEESEFGEYELVT